MRWLLLYIAAILAVSSAGTAVAATEATSQPIELTGTLIEPPACTINSGNDIDVFFGDNVGINRVDGINYQQPVDYQIMCEVPPDGEVVTLGIIMTGTPTEFDSAAVQAQIDGSSSTDLGIKLTLGGDDFTLNKRVDIGKGQPVLMAVPVKKPGSTLPEGGFHATATLLADYE